MGINPQIDETEDELDDPPVLNPEGTTATASNMKHDDKTAKFFKDNDVLDVVR